MVKPTESCKRFVRETQAELWVDVEGVYFVVYPDIATARKYGFAVLDLSETYDVGAFEVHGICKAVLGSLEGVKRVL